MITEKIKTYVILGLAALLVAAVVGIGVLSAVSKARANEIKKLHESITTLEASLKSKDNELKDIKRLYKLQVSAYQKYIKGVRTIDNLTEDELLKRLNHDKKAPVLK